MAELGKLFLTTSLVARMRTRCSAGRPNTVNPSARFSSAQAANLGLVLRQPSTVRLSSLLRDYADDVWRFMTQAHVPFTNNLAERAVRMPKVKQKVSGCFHTLQGVKTYCVIRSYCATLHKQGANVCGGLI